MNNYNCNASGFCNKPQYIEGLEVVPPVVQAPAANTLLANNPLNDLFSQISNNLMAASQQNGGNNTGFGNNGPRFGNGNNSGFDYVNRPNNPIVNNNPIANNLSPAQNPMNGNNFFNQRIFGMSMWDLMKYLCIFIIIILIIGIIFSLFSNPTPQTNLTFVGKPATTGYQSNVIPQQFNPQPTMADTIIRSSVNTVPPTSYRNNYVSGQTELMDILNTNNGW